MTPPALCLRFHAPLRITSPFTARRLPPSSSSSSFSSHSAGTRCLSVRARAPARRAGMVRAASGMVGEAEFGTEVLQSELPVLVDFVADWCGPCRLIAPTVDWAAKEYEGRLKVVKIDHDRSPRLIEEYKVYGLPTLILFKNGQEVPESRREGAITKVKLKEYLDSLLEPTIAA